MSDKNDHIYQAKTDRAANCAIDAAQLIKNGEWERAYVELHEAAKLCWCRANGTPDPE